MKVHFERADIEEHKRAVTMNDAATIGKVQRHPNIIKMKEVFSRGTITNEENTDTKEVFAIMVLETIRGGELYYHIRNCKGFSLGVSRHFFK
jgi:serine/threonine protein kinase